MKIVLNITIEEDIDAPPIARWRAWEGDYDLGVLTGSGETPKDAFEDLMWHCEMKDFAPVAKAIRINSGE